MERDQIITLNQRYRLLDPTGSGGMATVYKAQDQLLGRTVAVKLLHEGLTNDEDFLRRFQKEAHAAANLAHPNIVTVHDVGQDSRRYYIVMEFVRGWTLKHLIRKYRKERGRPFHLDRTLDIAIQICAGVGYAHRANLVHCDVKSQNILVTSDGRVKVTDFGIARAISETSIHDDAEIWGTPQYFSPEQAAGEPATPASDVYSIGVIMFEMLTSTLPFEAQSYTALALKHIHEKPPDISQLNPGVPEQIHKIVSKILDKEPSGRYRTADQLGSVLISYRENSLEETGPIKIPASLSQKPVSEQETVPYRLNKQDPDVLTHSIDPALAHNNDVNSYNSKPDVYLPIPDNDQGDDWIAITLGIVALLTLLGLIPLWYAVFLRYTG